MNLKARTGVELWDLTYYLSQCDFKIKYSQGKESLEAECLSGKPVLGPEENIEEQLKVVNRMTLEDIIIDQNKYGEIQRKKRK